MVHTFVCNFEYLLKNEEIKKHEIKLNAALFSFISTCSVIDFFHILWVSVTGPLKSVGYNDI